MYYRIGTVVFSICLINAVPTEHAVAHGGGLDDLGCHHDHQLGGYHCHQGELAGLHFETEADAVAALIDIAADPSSENTTCPALGFSDFVTHVRDGDTIEVGVLPIRLQGIAAPENTEPGGPRATRAIQDLLLGRQIWCDLDGERSFDRCSAICYKGVADVGAVMVLRGFARDCPSFSGGRYERLEAVAAERGANIQQIYPLPDYCR